MKRNVILHLISVVLTLSLFITLTYAWWIGGVAGNKIKIITANIASKIDIYEGNDFNFDGNLDIALPFKEKPIEAAKGETGKPAPNIKLTMLDIAPTKVFTWKAHITNQGDGAGYVVCTLNKEIGEANKEYVKYFSIRLQNGTKVYLNDALTTSGTILFGGTEVDKIQMGKEADYVFQLELEPFDMLLTHGIVEEDRVKYQALQGKASSVFCMLDIALQSEKPGQTEIGL